MGSSPLKEEKSESTQSGATAALDSALASRVERLRNGDSAAFREIVELSQTRLYRFCFHLTGNTTRAQELAQDTYLKAFRHVQEVPSTDNLTAWLFRVAKNLFIDHTRSPQGKIEVLKAGGDAEEQEELLARIPDNSPQNLEVILSVREALSRLEPEERAVLVLVDFEEYSYIEAAELLGISEAALKARIRRARQAFLETYERGKE